MVGPGAVVRVRLAEEADSRDLWLWRNDEQTRRASLSTAMVEWGDHESWYSRSLREASRTIYIGETESPEAFATKVGMCRFDTAADGLEAAVSMNLDPLWRGRLLASPLLEAAIEAFAIRSHSVLRLSAVIRPVNVASRATFVRAGFISSGVVGDVEYYGRPLVPSDSN